MKSLQLLTLFLFSAWLCVSCSRVQPQFTLSFDVLETAAPFIELSPPTKEIPPVLVIASPSEITPPLGEVQFSEPTLTQLRQIDYERAFALLFQVGQSTRSGVVIEVKRLKSQVIIQVNPDWVKGNYAVAGYSSPYQLIAIQKDGSWQSEVEFILEDEDGNLVGQASHYIP